MFKWLFRRKRKLERNSSEVLRQSSRDVSRSQQNAAEIAGKIKKLNSKYQQFNNEYWSDLKQLLISTDMGTEMVYAILSLSQREIKRSNGDFKDVKRALCNAIIEQYGKNNKSTSLNYEYDRLNTFLIVGVNGVGKTTTIAKIAHFYLQRGQKILLVAADTFRAGAVEQLRVWANRLNVGFVAPSRPNQDPTSVVYEGLVKAKSEKYDAVLIDTAGRLQNKVNLMNELVKINKVFDKVLSHPSDETLLILDATIGQNGLSQAQIFLKAINVTGVVLTKMDSTAKGGIALKIKDELDLPVKLIGFGENVESLKQFNIEEYAESIIGD